ncbi:MAG TPA: CheR family methyltransferase [Chloroflexota bacterium]|nr:CheR family methyltransferase [Chloroflexota bacterium]
MMTPETVPADALASLAALVEARSGLRFVSGRYTELATKVARAFVESECSTWLEYQTQVTDGALFDQLVEALTIGETYFFRHRPYFDMLEREVLPEIVARRQGAKRLRIWCAGCATGEEAYSLAIVVRRVLPDVHDWRVSLLATDLNRAFLARAEAGLYGEWSFRETDAAFRAANFVAEGRRYRIRPELRQLVRFAQLNLAEDCYPSAASGTAGVDLILCRNVLLYFAQELTQRVVGRFHAALAPGGWLVLGPSDARPGLLADFEMRAGDGAIVYQRVDRNTLPIPLKVADAPVAAEPFHLPSLRPMPEAAAAAAPVAEEADWHTAWVAARLSADGGELDVAEQHCQQAIARAQMRPEPYYLFGALRQARGDDAGSLAAYRKALYVDPRFVPALFAQAAIHRRGGAQAQAHQALVRAQRLLEGRLADELVLADDGLTVGRLRDAVLLALGDEGSS